MINATRIDTNGFTRPMSAAVARRQLQVSAAVIAALAVCTFFVATATRFQPRYSVPAPVMLTVQAPGSIPVMQADRAPGARHGG